MSSKQNLSYYFDLFFHKAHESPTLMQLYLLFICHFLDFAFIFAAFFIWLTARQIDPTDFFRAFKGSRPERIGLAFITFVIGYGCRVTRWHIMLLSDNPQLRWANCAGPLLASFAANSLTNNLMSETDTENGNPTDNGAGRIYYVR